MTLVVAFLRGINVGGRTVKKEKLHAAFRSLGYRGVETYKQSGNVIYETKSGDLAKDVAAIEVLLRRILGYDVAVFIRTIDYLKNLVGWSSKFRLGEGTDLIVTLLPGSTPRSMPSLPFIIPRSTAEIVSAHGSEVFSFTHGGGEGGLPNQFLESKLKVMTTSRNMNVVRGIVEKYSNQAERPKT